MTEADIPLLPRGVRMHEDAVRGITVLLGPERVLMLDEVGAAILSRVDGRATLGAICDGLARDFAAPRAEIAADVAEYLRDLAEKRLLDLAEPVDA